MIPKPPTCPALVALALALGGLPGAAFLEDGAAVANNLQHTGSTASAGQSLSLGAFDSGGLGFGTANATVGGPMNGTITLTSSAFITSTQNQGASNAGAEFRLTDTLTVSAPGFAPGTIVHAKVAVELDGTISFSASGDASAQAIAQVAGPMETWAQNTGNVGGPFDPDPDGQMIFTIPLKIDQPEEDNLDLSVNVASGTNKNVGGSGAYDANAAASLDFELGQIIDITTPTGTTVYAWTVVAESGLDYGEGDPPPPAPDVPSLWIAKSQVTPGDLTVSWNADPAQALIIQGTTDGQGWFKEVDIDTIDGSFEVDPASEPHKLFRITTTNPTGPLSDPQLEISRSPLAGMVRLSWQAQAAETYRILSAPLQTPLVWQEIQALSAASGWISVDVAAGGPRRVYRILTSFTQP